MRQGIETGQELTTSCDIVSGLPEDALVIYPCSAEKKAGRVRLTPRFENEE